MGRLRHSIEQRPILWLVCLPLSISGMAATLLHTRLGIKLVWAVPFGLYLCVQLQRLIRNRIDGKTQHQRRVEFAERYWGKDAANAVHKMHKKKS